ncbi:hypothetical protein [Methylocapsa palsarum]|uniref:Uncharacterized protein n=1 Tax=Methylocapsa palsarum TaxID=1612308 RepID=A0A1I4AI24_9HYPH|nr:hypothetical protein [Methylocapsa palsarum]SFK55426.1 hypothetical protein SAMN05444581_11084 [Methylocapsa palsarum]
MKLSLLSSFAALVFMGSMVASVEEANAVVCARGVYRAGCAGPRGAVVARRPVYAPRAVVVAPRGAYVRRRIY